MKKIILSTFIIFSSILCYAQKNYIDQPYFESNVQVDTMVTPDRIHISILLKESDTKGQKSIDEYERDMKDVFTKLDINIKKQLKVSDMTSNFKKYFLKKKDILKSKSFDLTVNDAAIAGDVISALESVGISNTNITKTEYSKMKELKLALKIKAVKKAAYEAKKIAGSIGQKTGKAIYISDGNTYVTNRYAGGVNRMYMKANTMDESMYTESALPTDFKKIEVKCNLNVTFILE